MTHTKSSFKLSLDSVSRPLRSLKNVYMVYVKCGHVSSEIIGQVVSGIPDVPSHANVRRAMTNGAIDSNVKYTINY